MKRSVGVGNRVRQSEKYKVGVTGRQSKSLYSV